MSKKGRKRRRVYRFLKLMRDTLDAVVRWYESILPELDDEDREDEKDEKDEQPTPTNNERTGII